MANADRVVIDGTSYGVGNVASVNGKTGDVVLNASDVNAVSSVNGNTGNVVIPTATTSQNGLMSATDKTKLGTVSDEVDAALYNFATTYDLLSWPVSAGKLVLRNNYLYMAKQDIPTQESWTSSHWRAIDVNDIKALLDADIADLKSQLYDISGYIDKQEFEWIEDSYVKQNGQIAAYNGWHRTDYIDIGGAETVYLYATSDSANARFNCWYDENKTYISDFLCNKYTNEYTPPANARYFILSCESSNDVQHGVRSNSLEAARANLGVEPNRPAYYYRGTLAASDTYDTGISIAPKIGFKFGLYAKLTGAFAGLTIQFDAYSPNQIIIDTTNVTLKYRFYPDVVLPHSLTIADDIMVNVIVDDPTNIHVSIASKGVENTVTGAFEITAYETLKLINGAQALSDMVLSVGCSAINHDTWVIGDSYLGMTGPSRWGYYLNANGYMKGVMVCASSGSGYNEAALWLTSLMSMGTPRKIVWCMGMNYGDSEWLLQTQELRDMCEANTIELILATIPSVPSKNNETKNNYVRSSGLRYIDFAAAVGAQSDGTWYDGMLSTDNVHPSVSGALALYNMAIASVPELTYD